MKHVPKNLEHEVNVAKHNHLLDITYYLSGAIGIIVVLYLGSGLIFDKIIDHLSLEQEEKILSYLPQTSPQIDKKYKRVEEIFNRLHQASSLKKRRLNIEIIESSEKNAFAGWNGTITVLEPLIKDSQSENELAMVLAHEIGHYAGRDHLRRSSRGLFAFLAFRLLLGSDSNITSFLESTLQGLQLNYSQNQESAADYYGIELVNKVYGHINGSLAFFEKNSKEAVGAKSLLFYFSTHPHPKERIELINNYIDSKKYKREGEVIPLRL